ncbi:MAG TPA: hypothetical protein VFS18_02195, partial [Actinomycetota bacterium]|nr:hypothetical protein [Actinomycetota bacterium]
MSTHIRSRVLLLVVAASLVSPVIVSGAAEPLQDVRFRDVTARAGLPMSPHMSFGAVLFDHDLDGDPDIFVNEHWRKPSFFDNREGSFRRSPETFFYT